MVFNYFSNFKDVFDKIDDNFLNNYFSSDDIYSFNANKEKIEIKEDYVFSFDLEFLGTIKKQKYTNEFIIFISKYVLIYQIIKNFENISNIILKKGFENAIKKFDEYLLNTLKISEKFGLMFSVSWGKWLAAIFQIGGRNKKDIILAVNVEVGLYDEADNCYNYYTSYLPNNETNEKNIYQEKNMIDINYIKPKENEFIAWELNKIQIDDQSITKEQVDNLIKTLKYEEPKINDNYDNIYYDIFLKELLKLAITEWNMENPLINYVRRKIFLSKLKWWVRINLSYEDKFTILQGDDKSFFGGLGEEKTFNIQSSLISFVDKTINKNITDTDLKKRLSTIDKTNLVYIYQEQLNESFQIDKFLENTYKLIFSFFNENNNLFEKNKNQLNFMITEFHKNLSNLSIKFNNMVNTFYSNIIFPNFINESKYKYYKLKNIELPKFILPNYFSNIKNYNQIIPFFNKNRYIEYVSIEFEDNILNHYFNNKKKDDLSKNSKIQIDMNKIYLICFNNSIHGIFRILPLSYHLIKLKLIQDDKQNADTIWKKLNYFDFNKIFQDNDLFKRNYKQFYFHYGLDLRIELRDILMHNEITPSAQNKLKNNSDWKKYELLFFLKQFYYLQNTDPFKTMIDNPNYKQNGFTYFTNMFFVINDKYISEFEQFVIDIKKQFNSDFDYYFIYLFFNVEDFTKLLSLLPNEPQSIDIFSFSAHLFSNILKINPNLLIKDQIINDVIYWENNKLILLSSPWNIFIQYKNLISSLAEKFFKTDDFKFQTNFNNIKINETFKSKVIQFFKELYPVFSKKKILSVLNGFVNRKNINLFTQFQGLENFLKNYLYPSQYEGKSISKAKLKNDETFVIFSPVFSYGFNMYPLLLYLSKTDKDNFLIEFQQDNITALIKYFFSTEDDIKNFFYIDSDPYKVHIENKFIWTFPKHVIKDPDFANIKTIDQMNYLLQKKSTEIVIKKSIENYNRLYQSNDTIHDFNIDIHLNGFTLNENDILKDFTIQFILLPIITIKDKDKTIYFNFPFHQEFLNNDSSKLKYHCEFYYYNYFIQFVNRYV